jgi:hypothetical protein
VKLYIEDQGRRIRVAGIVGPINVDL